MNWFLVFLLFSLIGGAWGSCLSGYRQFVDLGGAYVSCYWGAGCDCESKPVCGVGCPSVVSYGGAYFTGLNVDSRCHQSTPSCGFLGSTYQNNCGGYTIRCDTKLEADSLVCVNNGDTWVNGECKTPPPKDSITYGCEDGLELDKTTGQAVQYHYVYKLNVTQQTQELVEQAPMTCAQVGYCDYGQTRCVGDMGGYYGGESSSSAVDFSSSSGKVDCKQTGQFMNKCYFECNNGATGECEAIDGDCNLVDKETCLWDFLSSSSTAEGSSPSSQIPSDSIDYNKDYSGLLGAILDTLHHNNQQNDGLLNGQDGTNALLAQIANNTSQINNKQSLIVNNSSGGNGKDYTDAIGNIGDSLSKFLGYDGKDIDTSTGDIDTSGLIGGFIKWFGDDSLGAKLNVFQNDSFWYGENGDFGKNGDSVLAKASEIGQYVKGLVDSGAIRNYTDTLAGWSDQFNFDKLGGGSTSCPNFLKQTTRITIGKSSVDIGGLGIYLCADVVGGKTPWDIGRLALRLLVVITCFMWLFRVCTGAGNDDE